jgi:uridine phosphorylase
VSRPVHLRPHADVAERVLLPGDPGRALRLAQQVVEVPKMLNHHRGLWGYTGIAADGAPLTIQSTGIGGPSTAIVVEELIALGARRLVRVGTCAALGEMALGSLVIAETVLAEDGTSRALGAARELAPDDDLLAALRAAGDGAAAGPVVSADLFYDPQPDRWSGTGAVAVELSAGALLAVAARHGARAACVLTVSESPAGRIDPEALEHAEVELGRVGAAALGA